MKGGGVNINLKMNMKGAIFLLLLIGGCAVIVSGNLFDSFYTATEGIWQFMPSIDSLSIVDESGTTFTLMSGQSVTDAGGVVYLWGYNKVSFDIDKPIKFGPKIPVPPYYVGENKLPGITVDIDDLTHVGSDGVPLPETVPSLPVEVGIGNVTHKWFWYDFHILVRTAAKMAIPEVNCQPDAECESFTITPYIGLTLQKSIFDNDVSAYIGDIDIIGVEHRLTGGIYADTEVDEDEFATLAKDWGSPKIAPEAKSHVTTGPANRYTRVDSNETKQVYFNVAVTQRSGFETVRGGLFNAVPVGLNVYDVQTMYTIRVKLAVRIPPVIDPDPATADWYRDLFIPLANDFQWPELLETLQELLLQIIIIIAVIAVVCVVAYLLLRRVILGKGGG